MKIRFLQGFGGRETGEIHYLEGQIVDEEHGAEGLMHLAARGIVEILPGEIAVAPQAKPIVQTAKPKAVPAKQTPKRKGR